MSWKHEDGWNKPGNRSHRRPRDRKPVSAKEDSGEVSTWETSKKKSDKRRRRRRVTWIVGSAAIALLLLIAAAPTVASIFAPGIIASKATEAIAGRVEVGSVSLGWFGEQRVERLRLYDDKGEQRGEISAKTQTGLFSLIFAGGNYGTVTITGNLDASTDEKGRTFLEHTIGIEPKPKDAEDATSSSAQGPAPGPGEPIRLPENLFVAVFFDQIRITYGDRSSATSIEAARIEGLDGSVTYDDEYGAVVDLAGKVRIKKPGDRVFSDAGKVDISVTVSDLADAEGLIQTDKAEVQASIGFADISTDLLDLLPDLPPDLAGKGRPALGPTISATLEAEGTMSELAVTLAADAESFKANAPLSLDLAGGSIRSAGTIAAGLDLGRLSMLMPDRDALLGPEADVHVIEYPRLDITIEDLSLPIPSEAGDAADLRGAGAKIWVQIGELAAAVRTPGGDTRRAVGFEPAAVSLDAPDLAGVVRLRTDLNTTIDGEASGTLRVDLAAEGLLDDAGAISAARAPTIRGEVTAEHLVLAAFQPIAAAAGFDLTGIIGQTADLSLTAAPVDDKPGSTDLVLNANADHASASGSLRLDSGALRTVGDGITARFDRLAPLLADALEGSGLDLADVSGATIHLSNLHIDLAAAGRGDLSSVRLGAAAGLERFEGVLSASGESLQAVGFELGVEADPLGSGVSILASGRIMLDNKDAGSIRADLSAIGLLDESGSPVGRMPDRLDGTVTAKAVRTAALQPFFAASGLVLEEDIGPTLDLSITASARPGEPGEIPPTDLGLTLESRSLKGSGTVRIWTDHVQTTADGVRFTLDNPMRTLGRYVTMADTIDMENSGELAIVVSDLRIPLDSKTRTPDLPEASAAIEASLTGIGFTAQEDLPAVSVPRLSLLTSLQPGREPLVELEGVVKSGDEQGTLGGSLRLERAFEPIDDDGRIVLRPVGTISITKIPTETLGLLGITVSRRGAADTTLHDLVRRTIGKTVSLSIESRPQGDWSSALAIRATSGWHTLDADATITPIAGGAFTPDSLRADAALRITSSIARNALLVFLPREYALIEMSGKHQIRLGMETDDAGLLAGTMILEPIPVGLTVPDGKGGRSTLDPITLGADASFSIPLVALTDPDGLHPVAFEATINGDSASGKQGKILEANASARASLRGLSPEGSTSAALDIRSIDTSWLDTIAGMDGLLADALGDTARFKASIDADAANAMNSANATVEINTPKLKTTKPVRIAASGNTLKLVEPIEARWDMTPRIFDTLAPVEEGKAAQLRLAGTVRLTLSADELLIPLAGSNDRIRLRATLGAPSIPLRFSDGSEYTYQDLLATLNTLDKPGSARLRLSAVDPDRPDADAIDLNAAVDGLPDGSDDWSPQSLVLTGELELDEFPVRLLDAMTTGQGDLVELLGPGLDLDAHIKNLPRRGGTFTFDADTKQASSRIRATVRPHPADRKLLAVTLDEPMRTRLTHFDYSLEGKKIAFLPIFGSVTKIKGKHQPASVDISRLVAPVDGDISMILMDGVVDPGVVEYDFQRGLALILDLTKQNKQGKVGERMQPFNISMKDGVARFDNLVVPVGEFNMQARGAIDLINQTEDIILGVPAGAFASEVISKLPGAGGSLRSDVIVPVRRRGPLGQNNSWQPDFEAVLGNLFENLIRSGLEDLLRQGKD